MSGMCRSVLPRCSASVVPSSSRSSVLLRGAEGGAEDVHRPKRTLFYQELTKTPRCTASEVEVVTLKESKTWLLEP